MNKLHKSLNKLENKDTITGRILMEILCDKGLNYLPQVDDSFKDSNEHTYSKSYISEEPVKDMLFGYYQIKKDSKKTKSDIRQEIRANKSGFKPLFTIVAKSKEKNSSKSQLNLEIEKEIDLVRRQPSIGNNPPITQYFQLHTDNIEPVYYDLLSKMRFSSTDNMTDVRERVSKQFEKDTITSKFYEDFKDVLNDELRPSIKISKDNINIDTKKHSQVIINRLLFLLFIQEKGWLDNNKNYLQDKYKEINKNENMYDAFFKDLFFNTLCNTDKTIDKMGEIPHFNSGLFEPRRFVDENGEIYSELDILNIENQFFDTLFGDNGILNRYKVTIDEENPSEQNMVIDPEFVGQVFETFMNNKEREEKGTFYTPRPMTRTIVKNSLFRYLEKKTDIENLSKFIVTHKIQDINNYNSDKLISLLENLQIVDPAVGSGAFIIELMNEIDEILDSLGDKRSSFKRKKYIATEILYGVDIDPRGIELTKFRIWLNMVKDKDKFNKNDTLPNLDKNIIEGNTLSGEFDPINCNKILENYNNEKYMKLKRSYFDSIGKNKYNLRSELEDIQPSISDDFDDPMTPVRNKVDNALFWNVNFPEVFSDGGFNIVIGNPPYVNGSGKSYIKPLSNTYENNYDFYEKIPGMSYDLYQKFIIRGWEILSKDGVMSYITSDTFLTTGSKISSRNILLRNDLRDLILTTENTFDAKVSPCIFTIGKWDKKDQTRYINARDLEVRDYPSVVSSDIIGRKSYSCNINNKSYNIKSKNTANNNLKIYNLDQEIFNYSISKSLFEPNRKNINIFNNIIKESKKYIDEFGNSVFDSKIMKKHINNLDHGDITLLGLIVLGGVGLQTGSNDNYIAYIENSKGAKKIKERNDDFSYVTKNENRYSWMSRVIKSNNIYDSSKITEEQKLNGIDSNNNPTWVPIIKGKGQSYYSPIDKYINWSKESVEKLKESSSARWQGYDYFFEEGIFAAGQGTGKPTFRYANNSVVDHSGNMLVTKSNKVTAKYLNGVMNSSLINDIIDNFINSTVNTQITDIKKVPIVVPTESESERIESLVDKAIKARKNKNSEKVEKISEEIDDEILSIYGFP